MTDETNLRVAERNAGLLLIAASVVALVLANSALAGAWHHLLEAPLGIVLPRIGMLTPHLLVADGLMAIFFLLVGLEVKREWVEGRLSTPDKRRLPVLAAAGGMALPALVYLIVVDFDFPAARGWAIPAATDIAFAIGVLALLGRHAPPAIKLLLVTIAIADDVGAVAIIALAYTSDLDATALAIATVLTGTMMAMARAGVRSLMPYLVGFVLLWLAVMASGIHATIAGVVAAITVPIGTGETRSPLKRLEHSIHPWVMFGIVPLFGLVSAGVTLPAGGGILRSPITLGVAAGLFLGKQFGVFGALWLAVKAGIATKPEGASWRQLYGAAMLCGIGFTMSLFIGALAFPGAAADIDAAKIGTLIGSLLSAIVGFALLRTASPVVGSPEDVEDAAELFAGDTPDE
jgi:NhaA family Na+:H+ antiporter